MIRKLGGANSSSETSIPSIQQDLGTVRMVRKVAVGGRAQQGALGGLEPSDSGRKQGDIKGLRMLTSYICFAKAIREVTITNLQR